MFGPIILLIGFIINFIGTSSYLIDTLKGKIKPNRVTFFIWPLAAFIAFLAQVQQKVGYQALFTFSVFLLPFSVFVASFFNKKAYWKLTTFDLGCGALSIVGLILWQITKVGNVAIAFSILADGLATLPTIVKAYRYPETESAWPWATASINGLLVILTIKNWNFATYGFPIYYFIAMTSLWFFAQTKIGKRIQS